MTRPQVEQSVRGFCVALTKCLTGLLEKEERALSVSAEKTGELHSSHRGHLRKEDADLRGDIPRVGPLWK